jgi:hypothetical protein
MFALLLGIAHHPALARAQQPAGRVTRFDGRATITRAGIPSPAVLDDPVFRGDRITLGPESHMRVLLGDVAVLTAHPFAELTITEEPGGRLTTLNAGKVSVEVNAARLTPGEVHEIRTPLAVVHMRGARVTAEVWPDVTCI